MFIVSDKLSSFNSDGLYKVYKKKDFTKEWRVNIGRQKFSNKKEFFPE